MANLIDNINQVNADMQSMKAKLIELGVEMPDGTPSSEWAGKIQEVYNMACEKPLGGGKTEVWQPNTVYQVGTPVFATISNADEHYYNVVLMCIKEHTSPDVQYPDKADDYGECWYEYPINSLHAIQDSLGNIIHETYAEKIQISKVSPSEGVIAYVFSDLHNTEMRVNDSPVFIDFDIGVDVYPEDYTSSLVFDSGDTPPTLGYTKSPILNWIGTDCSITDGLSIFAPQANTHYDVLFYFNGTCFVGLVNGYKFASSNTPIE